MSNTTIHNEISELISRGKLELAVEKIEIGLKNFPDHIDLLLNAGYAYTNLRKWDQAIKAYDKLITIIPSSPSGFAGMGFMYRNQGNFTKAIEYFQKAIQVSPDNAMIHYEMGEIYFETDHFDKALQSYYKAIQFGGAETELEVLHRIAQTQLGLNDADKAIEVAQNVLRRDPSFATCYYLIAGAFALKEDWKQAKENLEKYLSINSDDADAQEMLKNVNEKL